MQKLFWFGCFGMLVVAGVVYLAANSEPKAGSRTLGAIQHRAPSCERLSELAAFGSCVHASHEEETCTLVMPPQIIDVCETPREYVETIAEPEYQLIPAGAVETVAWEGVEAIGLPCMEEEAEEIGMPRSVMPGCIEETEVAYPPMSHVDEDADAEVCDETDNPFCKFWMSLFRGDDEAPSADEPMPVEEEAEECSDEHGCQVDPHHSEYYPACPYTGRSYPSCPSCPSSVPANTAAPRGGAMEECEPCPKMDADPEVPAQPGVDTMEYRPSDGKDGEFESKPM